MRLSTTIITLNEEKYIEQCIKSVKGVSNEVIVVDSGSTDKTVEIAKQLGAKVFERKFTNYADQKNFAARKATGEWIFSIDADEEASNELSDELISEIRNPKSEYSAFSIPRKNIIFGKFIKFSRWQPELDRHVWLWKKDKGKWVGNVHEEVVVEGKVGKLKGQKIHHSYENVYDFLAMMNSYSDIDAAERVAKGVKFSVIRLLWNPFYNFVVRYFYRLGFLDGWRGFVLSYLMAVYHFELWIKIWERSNS